MTNDKEREWFLNPEDLRAYEEEIGHRVNNPKFGTTSQNGIIKPIEEKELVPPLVTYTGSELAAMNLKPPDFIVANRIPVGLGILAAPSKAGKSWMVFDLGLSVVQGCNFLGYETYKAETLYLALEDSLFRVEDRGKKIMQGSPLPDGMHIAIESRKTNNGLPDQITEHIETYPKTKIIIIDTFQMVKPSRGKKDAYEFDYEIMGQLRPLTTKFNICILLIHHTRKSNGRESDPFEEILGSTALQGATDFMLALKTKVGEDISTLYGRGRDFESFELAIKMNWSTYKWENLGDAEALERSKIENEYRNHPAIKTLFYKLDEIQNDINELVKEYIARPKDFRDDVAEYTGEVVGTGYKNFMTEVTKFDPYLIKDGIQHIEPIEQTTYKGRSGRWHRYKKRKEVT